MKSWAKPTPELVTRAIAGMPHPEQQRYFFERLENPEWIEPLRKARFFDQLPTPVREENSIGYYLWPAGRYLSRMAKFKPDLVADIMAKFPATDNPFVVQDILTAAASMPPASALKLADAVARTPLSRGLIVGRGARWRSGVRSGSGWTSRSLSEDIAIALRGRSRSSANDDFTLWPRIQACSSHSNSRVRLQQHPWNVWR